MEQCRRQKRTHHRFWFVCSPTEGVNHVTGFDAGSVRSRQCDCDLGNYNYCSSRTHTVGITRLVLRSCRVTEIHKLLRLLTSPPPREAPSTTSICLSVSHVTFSIAFFAVLLLHAHSLSTDGRLRTQIIYLDIQFSHLTVERQIRVNFPQYRSMNCICLSLLFCLFTRTAIRPIIRIRDFTFRSLSKRKTEAYQLGVIHTVLP
jgi:uncharacterized membrane protein YhdT